MALGVLSGFTVTRVATTADTTISPCYYFAARLSAGAAAVTCSFYMNSTAAANKILELSALANSADECGFPIRVPTGALMVKLSANTGEAFVGVR